MKTLLEYLHDARPYRSAYVPVMPKRPLVVACTPQFVKEATQWARDSLGRPPDRFYLGGLRCPALPAARIASAEFIRQNPDYATVIFGPKPRRMALEISLDGIGNFHFSQQPDWACLSSALIGLHIYENIT